jgi:hypothetical protein
MKNLVSILIVIAFAAGASAQTFQATPPKKDRKVLHPPPVSNREEMQGAIPRGFRGGNPLQMLNPKAPAKYGTWVQSTTFDPNVPGKWKGIKLFEIVF